MSTAIKLKVPAQGSRRSRSQNGKLAVPDQPDHPVHRGRRHRPGHLARLACACSTPRSQKAYGGKRKIDWMEVYAGREGVQRAVQQLAARRDRRGLPRVPGRHQGPADHADRRRHPLAERRAAPDARPVRLPAPGALVQGRALAGQGAREGRHGDLPREHRGHLRRHRVRGRLARTTRSSWSCSRRRSRRSTPRSASRRRPASASSRSRRKAPSACSAPPSSTRSPTSARA